MTEGGTGLSEREGRQLLRDGSGKQLSGYNGTNGPEIH